MRDFLEDAVTSIACSFGAFLAAFVVVVIWAVTGPFFDYSDTWQLVINTGTTIVTFLIAFLLGANQRRADAQREQLLELMERQISALDVHVVETRELLAKVHAAVQVKVENV